jgi:hypothetical protein
MKTKTISFLIAAIAAIAFVACSKLSEGNLSDYQTNPSIKSLPGIYDSIELYMPESTVKNELFVDFYNDLEDYKDDPNHEMSDYSLFDAFWLTEAMFN